MSSVYDILNLTGYDQLSKKERWSLIDQLDRHTDALQQWRTMVPINSTASTNMADLLVMIRRKRLVIWQSLYPATGYTIRLAA